MRWLTAWAAIVAGCGDGDNLWILESPGLGTPRSRAGYFGDLAAVDGVSLTVDQGEVYGFCARTGSARPPLVGTPALVLDIKDGYFDRLTSLRRISRWGRCWPTWRWVMVLRVVVLGLITGSASQADGNLPNATHLSRATG